MLAKCSWTFQMTYLYFILSPMDIRLTTQFITPPFSLFFMFEFLVKVEYIAKSKSPLVLRAVSPVHRGGWRFWPGSGWCRHSYHTIWRILGGRYSNIDGLWTVESLIYPGKYPFSSRWVCKQSFEEELVFRSSWPALNSQLLLFLLYPEHLLCNSVFN